VPVCDLTGFDPVPPAYAYTLRANEAYRRPIREAVARALLPGAA
jgi:hypothetical protein